MRNRTIGLECCLKLVGTGMAPAGHAAEKCQRGASLNDSVLSEREKGINVAADVLPEIIFV